MAPAAVRMIDTHVHVWQRSRFDYPWITKGSLLDRNVMVSEIRPIMQAQGVIGGILVEAASTPQEIPWLLDVTEGDPLDWGVIGWLDPADAHLSTRLHSAAQHRRFKGLRLNALNGVPDAECLGRIVDLLWQHELVLEVLTRPDCLPDLIALVARFPHMMVVIDHLGGATLSEDTLADWRRSLAGLAALPQVILKVSGCRTPDGRLPTVALLRRYLDAALGLFGPARLMMGSDYPLCLTAAPYSAVLDVLRAAASGLAPDEQRALLSATAARVYRLNHQEQGHA